VGHAGQVELKTRGAETDVYMTMGSDPF
jgi:hypothetical protein